LSPVGALELHQVKEQIRQHEKKRDGGADELASGHVGKLCLRYAEDYEVVRELDADAVAVARWAGSCTQSGIR